VSHLHLQRALYLALYDEGFALEMRADPEGVLAPLGLEERERVQLVAVDPRAFRTDPLRRRRALRILAEEYKAATTLAMAETRSPSIVEGFFASRRFRRAVVDGDSFAPAFGEYLLGAVEEGRLSTPHLGDVTRLELAGSRARRGAGRARPGVALAPGTEVVRVDGGTLETIQQVERWLFELGLMPQVALCDDRPTLPPLPARGQKPPACYLVTATQLVEVDEDLYRVLAILAEPRPRSDAAAALGQAVPNARVEDLLTSLIDDGLVAETSHD